MSFSSLSYRSIIFRALGFLCLGIGFMTALIPLVPTVPFFLLAAFFLSRSSPEWHRWIRLHKQFGRTVRAWEDHGVLDWKIKAFTGSCLASAIAAPIVVLGNPNVFSGVWIGILIVALVYVVTRPSKI